MAHNHGVLDAQEQLGLAGEALGEARIGRVENLEGNGGPRTQVEAPIHRAHRAATRDGVDTKALRYELSGGHRPFFDRRSARRDWRYLATPGSGVNA